MKYCKETKHAQILLQPFGVSILYLSYFKLSLFDLTEFIDWNIKGLGKLVAKVRGLENQR